jgi:hypothetical protein
MQIESFLIYCAALKATKMRLKKKKQYESFLALAKATLGQACGGVDGSVLAVKQ